MIRRTVARAFGMSGDDRNKAPGGGPGASPGDASGEPLPAAANGSRMALLNQFFGELQEAFERAAGGGANGAPGEDAPGGPSTKVSKTRPRPEGLEFLIEGPGGNFRFLNALDGIIWIYREENGRHREDRLLSVQFQGTTPRLIEKPAGGQRSPFRFTSLPRILKEFLS